MPLGSANSRNAVLNASLSGADAPTNLYLALYNGNPTSGGTEMSSPYARQALPKATAWAAASAGVKATAPAFTITFPTGWSGTITYAALVSTASGAGDIWDYGPLASSIVVTTGTTITVNPGALSVSEA